MLFHIHCIDRPGSGTLRPDTRPAHLEYLEKFKPQIITGGPLLSPDGTPIGSLLVMEFENEAAAQRFSADDPYTKAGLFANVTITRYRQGLPVLKE
jgi:uncharacterized protein YciI